MNILVERFWGFWQLNWNCFNIARSFNFL